MAVWMELGSAVSAGSSWSRAASTARRSSSKKGESFIVGWNPSGQPQSQTSQFGLPLGIKRFCDELSIRFLEQDFHAALGFFQLLLAFSRQAHAFLKKLHRIVQRKLRASWVQVYSQNTPL